MSQVARYAKMTAREGKSDDLAKLLLAAAEELGDDPGCELYLVSHEADDPAAIWVTELWRSRAELEATIEAIKGSDEVAAARELTAAGEMIELELLGGKGPVRAGDGGEPFAIRTLTDSEDAAAKHGFSEVGEARFASDDLGAVGIGLSHHRLWPGARQAFGHSHRAAEEVYVVLSGSGRVRLDDEIADVGPLDAIRVAPEVVRGFEAGPEGLELIAFGERIKGDAEIVPEWWID